MTFWHSRKCSKTGFLIELDLYRGFKALKQCEAKSGYFLRKYPGFSNHDIFDSRSNLNLGLVSTDAHGLCGSCRSDLSKHIPFIKKLEPKNYRTCHLKIVNINDLITLHC